MRCVHINPREGHQQQQQQQRRGERDATSKDEPTHRDRRRRQRSDRMSNRENSDVTQTTNSEHCSNQTVPAHNPLLDDILDQDTCNLKLFVLDMDTLDMRKREPESPLASTRLKSMRLSDPQTDVSPSSLSSSWSLGASEHRPPSCVVESDLVPSICFDDYFQVETLKGCAKIESCGLHNSLFLAVARSLLYKIYFIDRKYTCLIKAVYANCLDEPNTSCFDFNSDMRLQEVLRKSLCVYWLGFVHNGEFIRECKYSRSFANACDFICQAYQLSVNNFSNNRLFRQFAVEDLAELLGIRVVVFEETTSKQQQQQQQQRMSRVYEPRVCSGDVADKSSFLNDSVYLEMSTCQDAQLEYKWLMPKYLRTHIENTLLAVTSVATSHGGAPTTNNYFFFKLKPDYTSYRILLHTDVLRRHFDADFINQSVNHALFLKFVCECSVHTLVSLDDIKFDTLISAKDSTRMIEYLNYLWGQNHFNLKEILNQIQFNNELERIQIENKNFIQEVFKFNTNMSQLRAGETASGCGGGGKMREMMRSLSTSSSTRRSHPHSVDIRQKNKQPSDTTTIERNEKSSCSVISDGNSRLVKRHSLSECGGVGVANLYQMSSCFQDVEDRDVEREEENQDVVISKVKTTSSKNEEENMRKLSSSGSSSRESPSPDRGGGGVGGSLLDDWKTLAAPLMSSLTSQQKQQHVAILTTNNNSNNKPVTNRSTGTQKRSLTWCLDSLINQAPIDRPDLMPNSQNLSQ